MTSLSKIKIFKSKPKVYNYTDLHLLWLGLSCLGSDSVFLLAIRKDQRWHWGQPLEICTIITLRSCRKNVLCSSIRPKHYTLYHCHSSAGKQSAEIHTNNISFPFTWTRYKLLHLCSSNEHGPFPSAELLILTSMIIFPLTNCYIYTSTPWLFSLHVKKIKKMSIWACVDHSKQECPCGLVSPHPYYTFVVLALCENNEEFILWFLHFI